MNNNFRSDVRNSASVTEHYYRSYGSHPSLSNGSTYMNNTQSASVTSSGALWHNRLTRLASENASTRARSDLAESKQNMSQEQKNLALIQLLRSWREGDEEEQRSTLQYLQQAIDEDRTSNRKMFP